MDKIKKILFNFTDVDWHHPWCRGYSKECKETGGRNATNGWKQPSFEAALCIYLPHYPVLFLSVLGELGPPSPKILERGCQRTLKY